MGDPTHHLLVGVGVKDRVEAGGTKRRFEGMESIDSDYRLGMMVIAQARVDLESSDPQLRAEALSFLSGSGEEGMLELWCANAGINPATVTALTQQVMRRGNKPENAAREVFAWEPDLGRLEDRYAELCGDEQTSEEAPPFLEEEGGDDDDDEGDDEWR